MTDENIGWTPEDDEAQEARERAKRVAELREKTQWRAVLATKEGRAVIWALLSEARIYHAAPAELQAMSRFEGARDLGLWALEKVFTADPNVYSIMRNEAEAVDTETGTGE